MLRDSDVLSMLMRRKPDYSLAQDFYVDPGIFQVDMDHIWYKEWVFAIPACEIPKSGDYIGVYSVVIVRGNDGQIRAFHNTCRHRGSILCKTRKGLGPKLVCPYHQWTYDLDGKLLWARDMGRISTPRRMGRTGGSHPPGGTRSFAKRPGRSERHANMNITEIHTFHHELPALNGPFRIASSIVPSLPSVIVRIVGQNSMDGWGETCPVGPTYAEAHPDGALAALSLMSPGLIGAEYLSVPLHRRMEGLLNGHNYAEAAMDIAARDPWGKTLGVPVSDLLGGALTDWVKPCATRSRPAIRAIPGCWSSWAAVPSRSISR